MQQFSKFTDKKILDALANSKGRINSMALIHTKLYRSENLASIDFGEYMTELIASIASSYALNDKVKYSVFHSKPIFDISLSINLGLIITELTTNAFKHAFNDTECGLIKIELKQPSANKGKLTIIDNGVGVKDIDLLNSFKSFGLDIVNALTSQINGSIEVSSIKGLKYVITFDVEKQQV